MEIPSEKRKNLRNFDFFHENLTLSFFISFCGFFLSIDEVFKVKSISKNSIKSLKNTFGFIYQICKAEKEKENRKKIGFSFITKKIS